MKKLRIIAFFVITTITGSLSAADNEQQQPWAQMLEVMGYAEIAKASLARGCLPENNLSRTAAYIALCPKLSFISNKLINDAALPFARRPISLAPSTSTSQKTPPKPREVPTLPPDERGGPYQPLPQPRAYPVALRHNDSAAERHQRLLESSFVCAVANHPDA
ncbi:unnamed protein product [Ilex paraguariensis]|uniref:Uncharacterized protein n=1 Tax=Ilex paraguariensis TaxID=185542 RepID=A0ABC8QN17_9AQUA